MPSILMSIQPRYAELLLNGEKEIEFRKRFAELEPGTKVVLYASSPVCAVVGICEVEEIRVLPLDELWRLAKGVPGESRQEFLSYYDNVEQGTAIFVRGVKRVKPIELDELRSKYDLEPPMSWRYLPGKLEKSCFGKMLKAS